VRTVAIDSVRGPLVAMLFERYATGQYTFRQLRDAASAAGLRTRPTKRFPAGTTVSIHAIGNLLKDRYYIGQLPYKDREYEGRHEPLVSAELFARVQEVLYSQRQAGTRDRKWDHHLKGLLRCGRCKQLLTLERGKSHTGRHYFYFLCLGRTRKECDLPRFSIDAVEQHVVNHWATVAITRAEADEVRSHLDAVLKSEETTSKVRRDQLKRERARIEAAEQQCVELIGNPDWPADKLTDRIRDLRLRKAAIDEQLDDATATEATETRQTVETLLEFLTDPRAFYRRVADADRRTLNRICFTSLYLDRDQHGITTTGTEYAATAAPLINRPRPAYANGGDLQEKTTANENGFHKTMGSEMKSYVHEGDLNPHVHNRALAPQVGFEASSVRFSRRSRR
jgi:site-specific DNA recombinase